MKVEITRPVTYKGRRFKAGQVVNLAKADAEHLIDIRFATGTEPAGVAPAKTKDARAE